MRNSHFLKLAAILVFVPGVAVAVATAGTSSPPSAPTATVVADPSTTAPASAPARKSEGPLDQRFSVLHQAKKPSDTPPGNGRPDEQADMAASRRTVLSSRGAVYAVPAGPTGSEALCVIASVTETVGGTACTAAAEARQDGVFVVRQCFDPDHPEARVVAGVVPDDIREVAVERGAKTLSTTTVNNNGFVLASDTEVDTVSIGGHEKRLPPVVC